MMHDSSLLSIMITYIYTYFKGIGNSKYIVLYIFIKIDNINILGIELSVIALIFIYIFLHIEFKRKMGQIIMNYY